MGRILRVGGALAFFAGAAAAQPAAAPQQTPTPQQQVDAVMKEGVGYAKVQIEQTFSFLPFAILVHADGRSERMRAPTGDELDPLDAPEQEADPDWALKQLRERIRREAKGDLRLVGVFSDDEVKLPDGKTSDAIQASIEHSSGYCTDVFVPYGRVVDDLTYGDPIASKAKGLVFRCE